MKSQWLILPLLCCLLTTVGWAENIDPDNNGSQYAYGENVGWFNFQPDQGPGVHASSSRLTGYLWQENVGWINLSPASYGGVNNDGNGNLSGYAWGENIGWINFAPNYGGVSIDENGDFQGWAWGENIGWIHLSSTSPVPYKVTACKVGFNDLVAIVTYWLAGPQSRANLDGINNVDLFDFDILASYWLDFCPDDWPL